MVHDPFSVSWVAIRDIEKCVKIEFYEFSRCQTEITGFFQDFSRSDKFQVFKIVEVAENPVLHIYYVVNILFANKIWLRNCQLIFSLVTNRVTIIKKNVTKKGVVESIFPAQDGDLVSGVLIAASINEVSNVAVHIIEIRPIMQITKQSSLTNHYATSHFSWFGRWMTPVLNSGTTGVFCQGSTSRTVALQCHCSAHGRVTVAVRLCRVLLE